MTKRIVAQLGFSLLLSMGSAAALAADQTTDSTPSATNQSSTETIITNQSTQTKVDSSSTVQLDTQGAVTTDLNNDNAPIAAPSQPVADQPVRPAAEDGHPSMSQTAPSSPKYTTNPNYQPVYLPAIYFPAAEAMPAIVLNAAPTPAVPHDPAAPAGTTGWWQSITNLLASISVPALLHGLTQPALIAAQATASAPIILLLLIIAGVSQFVTRLRLSGYVHGARSDNLVAAPNVFATPLEMGFIGREASVW